MSDFQNRCLGSLWGSLVGDALGVPVEFTSRAACRANPVTGMRGYGTHRQPAGTWSDDGALLLCAEESLLHTGFDPQDMGERFVRWLHEGHWTAHGDVFDIGNATGQALHRIHRGAPAETAGGVGERDNGNGSLMRILPVTLFSLREPAPVLHDCLHRASAITHGHARSQWACVFFSLVVRELMAGLAPAEAIAQARTAFAPWIAGSPEAAAFAPVLDDALANAPETTIGSSGYVLHTLTAALWCLLTTSSFEECVLKAVNLGEDTDTTGCVAGGLAGACYGLAAVPPEWQQALPRQQELTTLHDAFTRVCAAPSS